MKTQHQRGGVLASLGAACLILAAPATAQIEELVVTAQKREQGINDVGITVNAFSQEQLDNYGVNTAADLEALTPGLTVSESAPNGVPVYTIRGVGFADYTTSASSTVGIYYDEAAIPYAAMSRGQLFDVERVEVLKGPQGDLYGRNTTGGQINFVSRKPTDEFEGGITLGYGRFGVLEAEGVFNAPVAESLRMRVAMKAVHSGDGWQRSLTRPGDTLGEKEAYAIRGLFDLDLGADAALLLNLRYAKDESDNVAPTPFEVSPTAISFLGGLDPRAVLSDDGRTADWPADFRPVNDNETWGVSARLNWELGLFTVTSISAYDRFERNDRFETSGVSYYDGAVRNATSVDAVSQEVRIAWDNDSNLYWTAGVYYAADDLDEAYLFTFFESPFLVNADTYYQQDTDSIAGFAHVEYNIVPEVRLTLGGRYTEEDRDWTGCTYDRGDGSLAGLWNNLLIPGNPAFGVTPLADLGFPEAAAERRLVWTGGCGILNDLEGTPGFQEFIPFSDTLSAGEWMGKVTLDYSPTDDLLVYGTASRGFKSGGFNGAAAQTHSQLLPYDRETLLAYEAGLKSTWLDGALQLNAAVFFYDYKDKQEPTVAVTPVGNISGLTNVPESEILGIEAELHWQPLPGLWIDLGVAWLDTEVKEYQAVDAAESDFPDVVTFDASGTEPANAPNWQAASAFLYERPVSARMPAFVGGDFSYKDDNQGSTQPFITQYALLNARAGLRAADDKWRITAWGRNLGNDRYWYASVPSNGVNSRMFGMPLTWGVSMNWNF